MVVGGVLLSGENIEKIGGRNDIIGQSEGLLQSQQSKLESVALSTS